MPNRSCIVSFTDSEGLQHSVEVTAESLYETAVLAIRLFREHECEPGIASRIEVEVRTPSVKHTLTVQKVRDWVNGAAKSPKEEGCEGGPKRDPETIKGGERSVFADGLIH